MANVFSGHARISTLLFCILHHALSAAPTEPYYLLRSQSLCQQGCKVSPPDLVVQLLAYWMDCCPTWQAFKKNPFKNNCQIGQQPIQRLESYTDVLRP
jgi:hypothetical protein